MLPTLHFPPIEARIRQKDGSSYIFDVIRKKEVKLTPEEWVRQHVIHWLIQYKKYPKSLIRLELGIEWNKLPRRPDVVIYSNNKPFMVIECKAASVKIDDRVFFQASVYNQHLRAPYIVATNGLQTYCCLIDLETKQSQFVDLPEYTNLI